MYIKGIDVFLFRVDLFVFRFRMFYDLNYFGLLILNRIIVKERMYGFIIYVFKNLL